ncbi:MAG: hypothetical protein J6K32_05315 [Clostridia bacterium]|nr:hypothetical protein [Clostridia bacterium]
MQITELRQLILDCCNDVVFTFNGKRSGISSEVQDYQPTFFVWHGADSKQYSNVDVMLQDTFFSGKSIADLIELIEFEIV